MIRIKNRIRFAVASTIFAAILFWVVAEAKHVSRIVESISANKTKRQVRYINYKEALLSIIPKAEKPVVKPIKKSAPKKPKKTVKRVTLSRGGSETVVMKKIRVELSMYCATGHHTASGTVPHYGQIAAPREMSFGTQLMIEGLGNTVFTVTDRGGYIKKVGDTYRIDIFTDGTEKDAIKFGRRTVDAWIVAN